MAFLLDIIKNLHAGHTPKPFGQVSLVAFGKHRESAEHIDPIGTETPVLREIRRALYDQGIDSNILAWDELQSKNRAMSIGHIFLWCTQEHTVVGRMWHSPDAMKRSSYPMIACVHCSQLSLQWTINTVLPRLKCIETSCVNASTLVDVREAIEQEQERLQQLAQSCKPTSAVSVRPSNSLAKLAALPELGPNSEGLYRILWKLEWLQEHTARVPLTSTEQLFWWIDSLLHRSSSVLTIMPDKVPWMDLITEDPTEDKLFCIRAPLNAIPLSSAKRYDLCSKFIDDVDKCIDGA